MNYREDAKIFKALADENRLLIINLLKTSERCACVLLESLKISQPTLSHHMKILVEAGLVDFRKEGKWMHYSLHDDVREKLSMLINQYF